MIWLAVVLLAAAALAPLFLVLRPRLTARQARGLAMDLHRTQLAELDRDLAEGRIQPAEHAVAVLEVQRRLLAAGAEPEAEARTGSRAPVLAVLVLVPLAAGLLYAVGGTPAMPSVSRSANDAQRRRLAEEARLIQQLRDRLAGLDPGTDQARQGYVLLGNVEEARGNPAAAAAAWRVALETRFDATLAVRTADAASRAEGRLTAESANLLRRALATAPLDAPWRTVVEERLRVPVVR